MKTLKFKDHLVQQILDGTKTTTWRLFDDKDLKIGDELSFLNADTGAEFAHAKITDITERELKNIDPITYQKTYTNLNEMIEHYHGFYGDRVNENSLMKMITFKLLF
ncbi:MAG: ASCH domain-containing protein [Candidatus Pacebacteria bacterium]|nr:ASCH domain-containing protein [Candidatus Paceibacterota bacterium]